MTIRRTSIFLSGLFGPLMVLGQVTFVEKQVAYFQQEVDYTIAVRLDDAAHVLHASESFIYMNNSTTTLDTLWIHLWPNAYRDKTSALCKQLVDGNDLDLYFAKKEERGWIDSLDFRTDNSKLTWGYHPVHGDIGWVKLNEPLAPGSSTTITTPFRVKIPDGKFSRLGHTEQAYYITQWYPKPAVFDATGWHAMPYLGNGEFYSELGSFDVHITLPANYIVGATGLLQEQTERTWMDSLSTVPNDGKGPNSFPASKTELKTISFKQGNVHDFAWFADKRFVVRKSEVLLPRSGRTVTTWAFSTPKNVRLWSDAVSYVNESVRLYSQWVGDYPYDVCTAVDGTISAGGGMEYPMITVIGNMSDKMALDNVIAHEVGHNWFYGILGSNERDHAWMDEGMNSFVELRYMRERYPATGFNVGIPVLGKLTGGIGDAHRLQNELGYRLNARRNLDQPIDITSSAFTETNYGTIVYMKTALVMDHLMAYLGEETMDRCMHAYFDEWKFKHPQPADMRKVFERVSDKTLGWVFEGLLDTDEKYDVKAVSLDRRHWTGTGEHMHLGHRAKGPWRTPFSITGYLGTDSLGTVWDANDGYGRQGRTEFARLPWDSVDRVHIDIGNRTLDIDRRNNEVRSHGLLRRWAKPELKFLFGLEKNDRRSVYWTPLPAWNGNDGWQLGVALHNTTFPSQRTEWIVAPLYGLASERWGGAARIEHHFDRLRSDVFQNIHVGLSARSASTFHDHQDLDAYTKLSPYIRFDFKRDPLSKPWKHDLSLRGIQIWNSSRYGFEDGSTSTAKSEEFYLELQYRAMDQRKLHPTLIQPNVTATTDWVRTSIEVRQAFAYNAKAKQLRFRAFAGTFLYKPDRGLTNGLHAWGLTWGPEDMLYDHAYLQRGSTNNSLSRQYNTQQGGFKTPFLQGGSDTWIASMNIELDMPFDLPVAVFASLGAVPLTTVTTAGKTMGTATYFEAGIGMPVIKDVFEVWLPLAVSTRIADEEEYLESTVGERIRFVFALEKLDPTRVLRNLKP